MKPKTTSERGQALVLIALAIIGLVGLTALAIDGGNAYSDRRHAQNAADTAAFAAGLSKVRNPGNASVWKQEGLNRASDNGYVDTDHTSSFSNAGVNVEVYACDEGAASCNEHAGDSEYVQVVITSKVDTYFAAVVGIDQMTNRVTAIVRAAPPSQEPWFDGNALVSLMPGCKPTGYPHDPFTIGGTSSVVVKSSGIFVNSKCNKALTQNGNSSSLTADGAVCVVGTSDYVTGKITPAPQTCPAIDPDKYTLPNPTCSTNGAITETPAGSKIYYATPGRYAGKFPSVSPAGTLYLKKGIYCLQNGLDLNATWIIKTDLNNNGHDSSEGVFFFVSGGDVTFNGGSTINIHAVNSTADGFPSAYLNYLFYIPPSNPAVVTITGNNGSTFTGTILAPSSHVKLVGSGGAIGLSSQIIGYSTAISGSGTMDITYDANDNALATVNPNLQLTK